MAFCLFVKWDETEIFFVVDYGSSWYSERLQWRKEREQDNYIGRWWITIIYISLIWQVKIDIKISGILKKESAKYENGWISCKWIRQENIKIGKIILIFLAFVLSHNLWVEKLKCLVYKFQRELTGIWRKTNTTFLLLREELLTVSWFATVTR